MTNYFFKSGKQCFIRALDSGVSAIDYLNRFLLLQSLTTKIALKYIDGMVLSNNGSFYPVPLSKTVNIDRLTKHRFYNSITEAYLT